jgi:serine/threonine protein phosphatase PrpC
VADKTSVVLQARGVTDKGTVRPTNEDRFAIDEALGLCVIADGMGGHNAGEIAAHTAVDAVLDLARDRHRAGWPFGFDPSLSEGGNLVRTAIYLANMHILEMSGASSAYAGMGTTIVAALAVDGRLTVGHVGDSRLYRMKGGCLRQLTGDDSWMAAVMAKNPRTDAALFEYHPMRHVLTNVVGTRSRTEVHVTEEPLENGDQLVLTTDGVHGTLDERSLARLVSNSEDVGEAARGLVQAAISRGSRDNCTAVVAKYL